MQCAVDLDRRLPGVNHAGPRPRTRQSPAPRKAVSTQRKTLVEKTGDKSRMNCAKVVISSTEKFKLEPFYCSRAPDSLPIFHPARESTGERKSDLRSPPESLSQGARPRGRVAGKADERSSGAAGVSSGLTVFGSQVAGPVGRLSRKTRRSGEDLALLARDARAWAAGRSARDADHQSRRAARDAAPVESDGGRHGGASRGDGGSNRSGTGGAAEQD